MTQFYNPYYFVASQNGARLDSLPLNQFKSGAVGHVRHDRWTGGRAGEAKTNSGRLICRLTVDSALVVGAAQERRDENEAAVVTPYRFGGKLAIPGSTLHGLISSVAEAASNSTLRVLRDVPYSRRVGFKESESHLGAVAIVCDKTEAGQTVRGLYPLALPPLLWNAAKRCATIRPEYLDNGKSIFPHGVAPLRVYLHGYEANGRPKRLTVARGSWVDAHRDVASHSSANSSEFWYGELSPKIRIDFREGRLWVEDADPREILHFSSDGQWVLGQRMVGEPLSQSEFNRRGKPALCTRGVLRILGIDGRESEIPLGKDHEWFLPFPSESACCFFGGDDVDRAFAEFDAIASLLDNEKESDSRKWRPYRLKQPRGATPPRQFVRSGDIVCFSLSRRAGQSPQTAGIGISTIWRKRIASTHVHFRSVDPELVPLQDTDSHRQSLTLAEQLFGFVAEAPESGRTKDGNHNAPALTLAGRVRCSGGQLEPQWSDKTESELLAPEVPLKVLSSPKAPSPAMYFQPERSGRARGKKDLKTPQAPRGRKMYVHHPNRATAEPWRTLCNDRQHLRVKVRPIKKGVSFLFHLDFENLSDGELDLLCYALHPTDAFRHKLGLGKPIGLGTVHIEPVGLFLIKRTERYGSWKSLVGSRYSEAWKREGISICQILYPREAALGDRAVAAKGPMLRGGRFRAAMLNLGQGGREVIETLENIGDPRRIPLRGEVMYPQVHGRHGADLELEGFLWFQANDERGVQRALPLRVAPLIRHVRLYRR